MSEQLEARIVVQQLANGKAEVFLYDPKTGAKARAGMTVRQDEVDREVRSLKLTLEKAGHRVTVVGRGI